MHSRMHSQSLKMQARCSPMQAQGLSQLAFGICTIVIIITPLQVKNGQNKSKKCKNRQTPAAWTEDHQNRLRSVESEESDREAHGWD